MTKTHSNRNLREAYHNVHTPHMLSYREDDAIGHHVRCSNWFDPGFMKWGSLPTINYSLMGAWIAIHFSDGPNALDPDQGPSAQEL